MKGISLTTASWSLSVSFLSFLSDSKSDRRKYNMESFWKFGFAELSDIGAQKMASLVFFCKSFNSTPIFSCCASPHVPTFFSDGQVSEKSMNKFPPCSPPGESKTWPPSKINLPFHWSKFSQNTRNTWKHLQPLCYAPSYPSLSLLLLSSSQGSLQSSLDTPEDVQGYRGRQLPAGLLCWAERHSQQHNWSKERRQHSWQPPGATELGASPIWRANTWSQEVTASYML